MALAIVKCCMAVMCGLLLIQGLKVTHSAERILKRIAVETIIMLY